MLSHEIESTPWSKIGIDICFFEGRSLLITSDYYSNFRTVRKINNQNTNEISNLLLGIFETHVREKFKQFAKEPDITVITTSSYLPRRNGKAENAVIQSINSIKLQQQTNGRNKMQNTDASERNARYEKIEYYYDYESTKSETIKQGGEIRIRKPNEEAWTKGKCLKEVGPRSFEVIVDDKIYRRNK